MQKKLAAMTALGILVIAGSSYAADLPGVTATEIRIGNTMPYSGPAAPYGTLGKAATAYITMINEQGGVAGHKINFVSLDDQYTPPKTVEQTRKLVEEIGVAFIYGSVGTAANLSVRKYLNDNKVPQMGILSGASDWMHPDQFPYSMSGIASYQLDGQMVANYVLKHKPGAKIAVLYQNDDFGRDHLVGLKKGLGDKVGMIIKTESFEVADPTVDQQTVSLQSSGADVLYIVGIPKLMASAIRKADEIGWKPQRFMTYTGSPVAATLTLAGLERSKGIISHNNLKDPQDPTWANDPEMKAYVTWMNKYYPQPDIKNGYIYSGYVLGASLVKLLGMMNGDFSRENVMKVFTHLDHVTLPGYLPGITISTTPTDYMGLHAMRDMEFNGERWVLLDADTTN